MQLLCFDFGGQHRGVGYNSEQRIRKAHLGVQKSMDLVKAKPGKKGEDTLSLNKPSEENRKSGEFNWTGPDSCEGPEAGAVRGPGRAENRARGESEPPNYPQGLRWQPQKLQVQMEGAKWASQRARRDVCRLELELNKPSGLCWQLPVSVVRVVWLVLYNRLSFCGSIIMLKLTWLPLYRLMKFIKRTVCRLHTALYARLPRIIIMYFVADWKSNRIQQMEYNYV